MEQNELAERPRGGSGRREKSPRAGYFARRPVRPGELPRLMKKHIFTGTMGASWGNLISGIILVYFGNAIGMTQLEWGILGGISAWVVIVQPLGAILGERARSRKFVFFWTSIMDRILRMLGITGAFFMWRAGNTSGYLLFMTAICVGTLVGNLAQGPWFAWLATIIPREVQGTFWGRRDSWISLVVILVTLPSGFLMDAIPQGGKVETAFVILLAASVLGFLDLIIHSTIPEPPRVGKQTRASFEGILTPFRDKRFRPWLVFVAFWNFGQNLGGALCVLYFMENLGFKNNLLGGMIAINGVGLFGTLFAARRVGRMVDRYGIKRMLMLGFFFWSLLPAIWLFATPATALVWVGLASLIGGAFPAAANNAAIKLVTRFPKPEESAMYMACSTTIASIAAGLGSIGAGAFLNLLSGWSVTILGLVLSGFPLLFIISAISRMTVTFTLLPKVRLSGAMQEEDRPFLLPMFFESVPGISRLMRQQRQARLALPGPEAAATVPGEVPGVQAHETVTDAKGPDAARSGARAPGKAARVKAPGTAPRAKRPAAKSPGTVPRKKTPGKSRSPGAKRPTTGRAPRRPPTPPPVD
jgi:MFS family permease